MKNVKPVFPLILAAAILGTLLLLISGHHPAPAHTSVTDTGSFRYEVVTTLAAQAQGLGGRTDVPHDYGMLFVFKQDDRYGFWMKDMLVPIDIIWLSDTGAILGTLDSVSPATYPNVFYPPEPVRYVLETRAGEAKLQSWGVGETIKIPLQD